MQVFDVLNIVRHVHLLKIYRVNLPNKDTQKTNVVSSSSKAPPKFTIDCLFVKYSSECQRVGFLIEESADLPWFVQFPLDIAQKFPSLKRLLISKLPVKSRPNSRALEVSTVTYLTHQLLHELPNLNRLVMLESSISISESSQLLSLIKARNQQCKITQEPLSWCCGCRNLDVTIKDERCLEHCRTLLQCLNSPTMLCITPRLPESERYKLYQKKSGAMELIIARARNNTDVEAEDRCEEENAYFISNILPKFVHQVQECELERFCYEETESQENEDSPLLPVSPSGGFQIMTTSSKDIRLHFNLRRLNQEVS